MININALHDIEKQLTVDSEHSNQFEAILKRYTGPDTGLEWDNDAKKLIIVPGWHIAENGDIVKD